MNRNSRNSSNFYLVALLLLSAILVACAPGGGGNSGDSSGGGAGGTPLQQLGITNIDVLQVGTNISISWDNPASLGPSITSYNITLREYTNADGEQLPSDRNITSAYTANQARQNINIDNLIDGRHYEIDIIVIGENNMVLLRTTLTANTALPERIEYDGTPPPPAPTMFAANSTSLTSLNISWDAPPATPGYYRLERRVAGIADEAFRFITRIGNSPIFHVDTNLMSSIAYDYRIAACRMPNDLPVCSEYVIIMDARTDIDNDGVSNNVDDCPIGATGWTSNTNTDTDGDGCQDGTAEEDLDNDSVADNADMCPAGETGWTSNPSTDTDNDGCQDGTAEEDLDNDAVADNADNCPLVANADQANLDGDDDGDACDTDNDNDTVDDDADNCPLVANMDQADLDRDGSGNVCDADADADYTTAIFDTNDLDATDMGGDHDGDGIMGINDVDDDGNGLIEILNVTALDSIRYNLAGTGLDLTNADNDNQAGGSNMGCGNGTQAGIDITTCSGYELVADIDLNDLIGETAPDGSSYRVGHNWERLGSCAIGPLTETTFLTTRLCDTSATNTEQFSAIFEGNNMTISNLAMHIDNNTMNIGLAAGASVIRSTITLISSSTANAYSGIGFFGAASSGSVVRNLRMENITISADSDIRLYAVGGLLGYGQGANIVNSAVELNNLTGAQYIGGLIGFGQSATISSSSAIVDTIESADDQIGGLIGDGSFATISSSSAIVDTIESAGGHIGGLIGGGVRATISSSSALVDTIESAGDIIGGLVGDGSVATISSSSAIVDTIESAGDAIGGLVGFGQSMRISSSSAIVDNIQGDESIGGLLGSGQSAIISNSLALSNEINGSSNVHQLEGGVYPRNPPSATNSYWQDGVMATNAAFLSFSTRGMGQTMSALQSPSSFTGSIYANWANAWCDPATGAFITDSNNALAIPANRVWDLGTSSEYPVISSACFGDRLSPQLQRTLIGRILGGTDLFPLP